MMLTMQFGGQTHLTVNGGFLPIALLYHVLLE
jgi:hypothetical protein